jgi:hypothetical protein
VRFFDQVQNNNRTSPINRTRNKKVQIVSGRGRTVSVVATHNQSGMSFAFCHCSRSTRLIADTFK